MNEETRRMQKPDRILSIDILRGFSILGIFLVNMPSFHTPLLYINPLTWWDTNPDRGWYIFTDIFAQASFYPLFAFLFGFGAILLAQRLHSKGQSFPLIFSRRLLALLAFGCIHAFLIWHGDILINYALFGFLFILFHKMGGKILLVLGTVFYLVPFLLIALLMAVAQFFGAGDLDIPTDMEAVRQSIQVYRTGTFTEIIYQRLQDWYLVNNPVGAIVLFLSIFPLFLVGAGFAKLGILAWPGVYKKQLHIILAVSLSIGLAFKLLPYLTASNYLTSFLQDTFGGPVLSLFYISAITLLLQRKAIFKIMKPLSYVGRLSLSNYLLQSILGTFLFYSYGLGKYGQISFSAGLLIAVVIFMIQVLASKIWLKYFRMGPVEYAWRFFTYWEKPHMRRNSQRAGGN